MLTAITSTAQAVAYFLDLTRMANVCYFQRLLHIVQSPQGAPLLGQLEASADTLCTLLSMDPDPAHPSVSGWARPAQSTRSCATSAEP